jgi:hypothetical protein
VEEDARDLTVETEPKSAVGEAPVAHVASREQEVGA